MGTLNFGSNKNGLYLLPSINAKNYYAKYDDEGNFLMWCSCGEEGAELAEDNFLIDYEDLEQHLLESMDVFSDKTGYYIHETQVDHYSHRDVAHEFNIEYPSRNGKMAYLGTIIWKYGYYEGEYLLVEYAEEADFDLDDEEENELWNETKKHIERFKREFNVMFPWRRSSGWSSPAPYFVSDFYEYEEDRNSGKIERDNIAAIA